jgi:hypothetical protein
VTKKVVSVFVRFRAPLQQNLNGGIYNSEGRNPDLTSIKLKAVLLRMQKERTRKDNNKSRDAKRNGQKAKSERVTNKAAGSKALTASLLQR